MSIHIVFLIRIERNVYFICEKMFYLPPLQSFFEIFHCFYLFMQFFISIKMRLSFCIDYGIKHFWELLYSYSN